MTTAAVAEPTVHMDEFVMNGVKRWITNARYANWFTVFGRIGDPAGRHKGIEIMQERHVTDDQDDRVPGDGRGAEGRGDDSIDSVRAAIRHETCEATLGRDPRVERSLVTAGREEEAAPERRDGLRLR